ncbi:MAG: prepilin-type N-terminal cleavage/methylation domain-containing protein [Planctomycetota bacterium]|nr:MAG: prepilin-type N-terminal cleavage/methylation domain-containing protein [Planctomycetota bacterium]
MIAHGPGRSGFTLIEMMLAMSVAAVIVTASAGLMRYVDAADGRLARRFEDAATLGRARRAFDLAFSSLLAAPDPEPAPVVPGRPADPERGRFREEPEDPERPPLFDLGPTDPDDDGPLAPRKIEAILKRSPIPGELVGADMIHGAFEIVPYRLEPFFSERGALSWAVLWTPLSPRGDTVVLAQALEYAAWEALNDDMEWNPAHQATEVGDYPRAIHVELTAWSGARADWLFAPTPEAREDLK